MARRARSGEGVSSPSVVLGITPTAVDWAGTTCTQSPLAICWASTSLSSRATSQRARSSPLVTPPQVMRSPSSTTRSGTTSTPSSASSSRAEWCVLARRPVIDTGVRPQHRPGADTDDEVRARCRGLEEGHEFASLILRPRSLFCVCIPIRRRPRGRLRPHPGMKGASTSRVKAQARRTMSLSAVGDESGVRSPSVACSARRSISRGPSASSSSTPSKTTMSINMPRVYEECPDVNTERLTIGLGVAARCARGATRRMNRLECVTRNAIGPRDYW